MFEPLYDKREKFIQLKEKLQKTFKTTCPSPSASFYPLGINFLLLHHSQRPSRNLPWNCPPWKRAPSVLVRNPLVQILACLLKLTLQQKETVSAGKRQRNSLSEEKGERKKKDCQAVLQQGRGCLSGVFKSGGSCERLWQQNQGFFFFLFRILHCFDQFTEILCHSYFGRVKYSYFHWLVWKLRASVFYPNNFTLNSTKKL